MPIKRKVMGQFRKVGIVSKVHVKKNRLTGRDRIIDVPIYNSIGIDDLGACIHFLVNEGHWSIKKKDDEGKRVDFEKAIITAPEFDFVGKKEKLIYMIERQEREKELKMLVRTVWQEIEVACTVVRKNKYSKNDEVIGDE